MRDERFPLENRPAAPFIKNADNMVKQPVRPVVNIVIIGCL